MRVATQDFGRAVFESGLRPPEFETETAQAQTIHDRLHELEIKRLTAAEQAAFVRPEAVRFLFAALLAVVAIIAVIIIIVALVPRHPSPGHPANQGAGGGAPTTSPTSEHTTQHETPTPSATPPVIPLPGTMPATRP